MTRRPEVAVLFARRDSVYKADPRCDVYDFDRDALTFPGGLPVIAHPPCRGWGGLRHFAKLAPGELELAPWAVDQVRQSGGVLEHPQTSHLWRHCGLPRPGAGRDSFGGFTLCIDQHWFGHRAEKRTFLYVVGIDPADLAAFPFRMDRPPTTVENMGHAEREHTPVALAAWLVALAQSCAVRLERAA